MKNIKNFMLKKETAQQVEAMAADGEQRETDTSKLILCA
ncbi:hypothetical protein CLOSBL3_12649 [Clostridiaceae bacterium BL-3]|nr:hypothetical protein CLOSBL3_12649 [Clostridiaceae bacterium BL-3]